MTKELKWTFDKGFYGRESDIAAAKKDQRKIEELLKKYPKESDAKEIYLSLQKEGYKFESTLGRKFDDMIFEKYQQIKKKEEQQKAYENGKVIFLHDFSEPMQKEIVKVLKNKQWIKRVVAIVCVLSCITSFTYFGISQKLAQIERAQYEELAKIKEECVEAAVNGTLPEKKVIKVHLLTKETVEKTILPEYTLLYEKNPNLIGWIKIEDTVIDYPVVQTSDNEFYLEHNFDNETDANGCIFLDTKCDALNNSDNMILYGHHMRSGNMFGNLNKYSSEAYYKEHKIISFDTIYEKGTYEVMYVFRSKVYSEEEITFKYYQFINATSAAEFNSAMNAMNKISLYDTGVRASYGDKLLTLSTCDYQENKGRFVVVARKVS